MAVRSRVPPRVDRLLLAVAAAAAALSALSALTAARAEDFYAGTDVIELTASNFRSKVAQDDHVWMVEFYAPWCGHCQRLKPDYIKAATATKGIVRFGAINCDEHKSIASEYGIRGFPTLKLFGANKKRPEDYNGARTAKAMSDAAVAALPNHVTVLSSSSLPTFLSANALLPKALLFTAKSSTTPLYKALAIDLKARMALGEVRSSKEPALMAQYGVKQGQLPALLVLPLKEGEEGEGGEGEGETVRYDGELKHKPLLMFLQQYALPKSKRGSSSKTPPSSSKPSSSGSSSGGASGAGKGVGVQQLKAAKEVEAGCVKGHGFCVIALLKGTDAAQVSQLQQLALKYHGDPLRFYWLDASTSPTFAALFLQPHDLPAPPAVAIISAKRGKFALHAGSVGEGLEALLDRAVGGDLPLLSKLPGDWHAAMDSK
ncbi:hypothetical protein CLOP_g6565 [Closterium sp. NIES-67]|nr:hypothetical protein CLOP_g6565 [Closterium sp. NIES-67]